MSIAKHTPGPWTHWTQEPVDGFICCAGVDTGDRSAGICELICENIETDDAEEWNGRVNADLCLITAAPELLEACRELANRLDIVRLRGYIGHPLVNQLRAAIAKAEGRQ